MKDLEWRADTNDDFRAWPLSEGVRARFVSALRALREGDRDVPSVKWMDGFDGHTAEIKISGYRVIATCAYSDCVYVVNAFKKDSARGARTRKLEIRLIKRRLKDLEQEKGAPGRQGMVH